MSMPATFIDEPGDIVYPESDGAPMADNPTQGRAIRYLVHGFERLFHGRADVFVGGDFFWYPVEGQPTIVQAPDVTVIVDLPGPVADIDMPSYRQWVYGGRVLLAVEVLSPSNTWAIMAKRFDFYERYGVDEYWVFDPYVGVLEVYTRDGGHLVRVRGAGADGEGPVTSPATGVVADVVDGRIRVAEPGGRTWLMPLEETLRAEAEAARAAAEAARADTEAARAEAEAARADTEAARAEAEAARAARAEAEVAALRAQLAAEQGR